MEPSSEGWVAPVVSLPPPDKRTLSPRQQIKDELARELHDQLAQNMISLLVQTNVFMRAQSARPDVVQEMELIRSSVREALNNLRQIIYDLRGEPGLSSNLVEALRGDLIASFERRTGVRVSLWVSRCWPDTLPPETSLHIYRIIQEALNNARKHGGATRAHVALRFASAGRAVITIRDNGQGIGWLDDSKPVGLGFVGMRERAAILGGDLSVRSGPHWGTVITASLDKEAFEWSLKPALSAS